MQEQVDQQSHSIGILSDEVGKVATDIEDTKQKYVDLSGTVEKQRDDMARAMEEYDRKLSGQEDILRQQEQTLTVLSSGSPSSMRTN
jgi:ABC-type transporter Mla subunit MlaD